MKPVTILLFLFFVVGACTKESSALIEAPKPDEPTPATPSTKPVAYAGLDRAVFLPADSCTLTGSFTGTDIQSVLWRKIEGPDTYSMDSPHLVTNRVRNLQKGVYQFELTATNTRMLQGKDTVTVTVLETSSNKEVIFQNLTWIFPWYASLEIKNIRSHVSAGIPVKVFIQRDSETSWIEVPQLSSNSSNNVVYEYFEVTTPNNSGMYNNGSLYVFCYGQNPSDTPNIKIIF